MVRVVGLGYVCCVVIEDMDAEGARSIRSETKVASEGLAEQCRWLVDGCFKRPYIGRLPAIQAWTTENPDA